MIEKLNEYKITKRDGNFINADNNTTIINTIVVKINEIIDTIYDMQLAISNLDPDSDWYDGNHIADTSKKVDVGELAYLQKENSDLKDELERTRKALVVAKDTLHWYDDNYDSVVARNTLDEITALEQKD